MKTTKSKAQPQFGYTAPTDLVSVWSNPTGKTAVVYTRREGFSDAVYPAVKVVAAQGSYQYARAALLRIAAHAEELAFEYDYKGSFNIDSDKVGNPVAYFEPNDKMTDALLDKVLGLLEHAAELAGFAVHS